MDVSLVSSLFRTEAYLPTFLDRARRLASELAAVSLSVEFVLIANDPGPQEQRLMQAFAQDTPHVQLLNVPRETLYASWNRGVAAASADLLGFWNVDDLRTSAAVVQGVQCLRSGCKLVYFHHEVLRVKDGKNARSVRYLALPYDAALHRRVMKCGPFFMFRRDLYEAVGPFDAAYRIVGDFDWCARATFHADFCPVNVLGGTFILHGGNLSSTGDPRQIAEHNIVALKLGRPQDLTPADPNVMRATWANWGAARLPLTDEQQAQFWGEGAAARYAVWLAARERAQRRQRWMQRLRWLPKQLVDRSGLRPTLARLGVVKARPNLKGQP